MGLYEEKNNKYHRRNKTIIIISSFWFIIAGVLFFTINTLAGCIYIGALIYVAVKFFWDVSHSKDSMKKLLQNKNSDQLIAYYEKILKRKDGFGSDLAKSIVNDNNRENGLVYFIAFAHCYYGEFDKAETAPYCNPLHRIYTEIS